MLEEQTSGGEISWFAVNQAVSRHSRQLSKDHLRVIIDAAPCALLVADGEGAIVLANQEVERLFGYAAGELFALPVEMLVPDGLRAAHAGHRKEFFTQPQARAMGKGRDLVGRRKDGSELRIEIGLTPLRTEHALFVVAAVIDVTTPQDSERRWARHDEALEQSNRDLQHFAYVAAHELKEPLRMISSYTRLLAEENADRFDETARRYAAFASDGAQRLATMIDDLLTYSRVQHVDAPGQPVDLNDVVRAVLADLAPVLEESRATVDVGRLPTVRGHQASVRQIFYNIVGNALKFHGDSPPIVRIEARECGDFWEVRVADNGIGIDSQFQGQVFDLFHRLHTRREYPGNGIGLAVCKTIVERSGGRIWLESQIGHGSTFAFTLPAWVDA